MIKIIIGAVVILLIGWGIYVSLPQEAGGEVKIGIILPLSGSQGVYGQAMKEGIDIAFGEIVEKGYPHTIRLLYEDNAGEVKNSVSAAQKLINSDFVPLLITGVSQHSVAVAPVAESNKTVLYTMASNALSLNTAGEYIFKNDDNFLRAGEKLGDIMWDLKHDKIGMVFVQYNDALIDFKDGVKKKYEEKGGKVTAEGFLKDEKDFRTVLRKINSQNPTALVINGLANDSALILKQIKEMGLKQKLFSNSAAEDPQVLQIGKEITEELVFVSFNPVLSPSFTEKIEQKYGHYPLRWSVEAYDGFHIVTRAISKIKGEVTADRIKEELLKIKSYSGESGEIQFDDLGNAQRFMFIKVIRDGKFVKYEN